MPSPKTIYLHMGTEKTGSTSIQAFLHSHEAFLRQQGFSVCRTGRRDMYRTSVHAPLYHALTQPRARKTRSMLRRLRREVDDTPSERCVLTSEGLCYLPPVGLAVLREAFGEHRVVAVIYLRRQDRFLESWFQQDVKGGTEEGRSFERFIEQNQAKLDYRTMVEAIGATLDAGDRLVIRPFEREQLVDGDVLKDFLAVLDAELPADFDPSAFRRLQAIPRPLLLFKLMINRMEQIPQREKRTGGGFYRTALALCEDEPNFPCDPRSTPVFPVALKAALLQEHDAGNRQIARAYLGRPDGDLFREPFAWDGPHEPLGDVDAQAAIPMLLLTIEALRQRVERTEKALDTLQWLLRPLATARQWLRARR